MKRTREHNTEEQPDAKRLKLSTVLDNLYALAQNFINDLQQWWHISKPEQQPLLQITEESLQPVKEQKFDAPTCVLMNHKRNERLRKRLFLTEEENPDLYI